MEPKGKRTGNEKRAPEKAGEPMVECVNCHKRFPLSQTVPKLGDWTEKERLCFVCERALYVI